MHHLIFDSDARAVSPVVGGVLLVAIVALLASVVGAMALSMDGQLSEPPVAGFDAEFHLDGDDNSGIPYLLVTHHAGDTGDGGAVFIVDSDGNSVAWEDIHMGGPSVSAGEHAHVDGAGSSDCHLNDVRKGEVYRIVWEGEGGDRYVVSEHEVETAPPGSLSEHTC